MTSYPLPDDGKPYGVCSQQFTEKQTALLPDILTYAAAARMTWARLAVSWGEIEQSAQTDGVHTYNWAKMDAAVMACNTAKMNCVLIIGWPPLWAHSGSCGVAPEPTMLATFAAACAQRYNGTTTAETTGYLHVETIEILNEEASTHGQCYSGTVAAQCFLAAYPAIQAVYPGVRVGFAAQLSIRRTDVTQWFADAHTTLKAAAIWPAYWNIHYYGYAPNAEQFPNLIALPEEIQIIRDADLAAGLAAPLPIWITETGYPAGSDQNYTQAQVAAYVTETLEICRITGVARCFWYTIMPGDHDSLVDYGPFFFFLVLCVST